MQTRSVLDFEINRLQERLLEMEDMVVQAIEGSIEALKTLDAIRAQEIIDRDAKINKLRYKIEKYCLVVIATQQPMASDLRIVIAAMHVAIELERMADHAAGIAKLVQETCNEPLLKPLIDLPRMAEIAVEMLHKSLRAFFERDVEAAREVAKRDDDIDALYVQIFRELLTFMLEDPTTIRRATYLLWAAHAVERIGDRITNIAERAIFAETGKFKELSQEEYEIFKLEAFDDTPADRPHLETDMTSEPES